MPDKAERSSLEELKHALLDSAALEEARAKEVSEGHVRALMKNEPGDWLLAAAAEAIGASRAFKFAASAVSSIISQQSGDAS